MEKKTILKINYLLLFCAMACLVCYDIFGGLWLKGVTSCWFVLLGAINLWNARKQDRKQQRFFALMVAGLFCGMCADVLLGKFYRRDLWIIVPLAALSMFVVVGTPWITVDDPFMQKMLLGYAVIISAMLGKSISNLLRHPCPARWLLALGSILFWFSDIMLAVDMFGQSSRLVWILCSYSYWPAQSMLAHSLCRINEE